jgi:hypothetical protein
VTFSFDAAVVHLASPINDIRPIMLVTPGVDALERPGTLATVTGWGNTIQQPAGPGGGGVRPASPAGASAAARPASRGLHPPQQPGVGGFILSVTAGVPVNSTQAA